MSDEINNIESVVGAILSPKPTPASDGRPAGTERPSAGNSAQPNAVSKSAAPVDLGGGAEDDTPLPEGEGSDARGASEEPAGDDTIEGSEPEAEIEAPDDLTEEELDAFTVQVKIDGKLQEVSIKELKEGFSGNQYIQQNIQKAVETRKQAEQLGQYLYTNNQKTIERLERLDQILTALNQPAIDWEKLRTTDPNAYLLKREEQRELMEKQTAVQQEIARTQQQQALLRSEAVRMYQENEARALQEKVPEFRSQETAMAEMNRLVKAASGYGFTFEEFKQVLDHRAILILRDAANWRESQEKQKAGVKTPAPQRKVMLRPQNSQSPQASFKRTAEKIKAKARATGKPDDVAAMLIVPRQR